MCVYPRTGNFLFGGTHYLDKKVQISESDSVIFSILLYQTAI